VLLAVLALAGALAAAAPAPARAAADLSLRLVVTPDPAIAGRPVTEAAVITNDGDTEAYGVNVLFVVLQPVGMSGPPSCFFQSPLFVPCFVGVLAPKASLTVPLSLSDVHQGMLEVTATTNMKDAQGNDLKDPTPENNSVAASTTVNFPPDLRLAMTSTPDAAHVGGDVTVTAAIGNGGLGPAPSAIFQLTLPEGATITSMPAGCAATAVKVACALGTLDSGATTSRAIVVHGLAEGVQTLLGSLSSGVDDVSSGNDRGQVSINVAPRSPSSMPTTTVPIGTLLSGLPKPGACLKGRRLVMRITPQTPAISASSIFVAGVRVRHRVSERLLRSVTLKDLPKRGFRLQVSDELTDGRRLVASRRVAICAPKRARARR
jgi:hypothetical protein